jgi:hypothetical protein
MNQPLQDSSHPIPSRLPSAFFTKVARRNAARLLRHCAVCLGLIVLVLFHHTCGFGRLTWGDAELGTDLPPVSFGIYGKGVVAAFRASAPWDACFGPLGVLSHAADFQMFGHDVVSHHLTSIWLHVFNAMLLFLVAKKLSKSTWVAALTALIFALHPMQAPTVVWITQRRILLATLFALASVLCWLRYTKLTGAERPSEAYLPYLGAVAGCFLTALSYPAAGCAVATIVLVHRLLFREQPRALGLDVSLLSLLPVWFIAGGTLLWSQIVAARLLPEPRNTVPAGLMESVGVTATHGVDVFAMLARAVGKVVTLGSLGPTSNLDPIHISAADLALALIGVALLVIVSRYKTETSKRVLFGLAWFITCGLTAEFTGRADAFAPVQWTYFANAGLAFAAACAVVTGLRVLRQRRLVRLCVPAVGVVLAWRGTVEMDRWAPGEPVVERALAASPGGWQSWRLLHAMGFQREREGNLVEARRYLRQALVFEWDSRTLLFMGYVERRQNNLARASLLFETVARGGRLVPPAETALAEMARDRGDLAKAAQHFAAALSADSRYPTALSGLAMIRAAAPDPALRDGKQALLLAKEAMRWTRNSDYRALDSAAAAHAELGQFRRAQALASATLSWTQRSGRTNDAASCQERLDAYKASKPWRIPVQRK